MKPILPGTGCTERSWGMILRGTITTNAQMLREWDVEGKNVGFNTGFNEVRLDNPVTFPGDPIEYTYRFDVPNLLSGWQ